MKKFAFGLALLATMVISVPLASAATKVPKPNPCTQAPVAGTAQSYKGCNFAALGAKAPSFAGQDLSGFNFSFANMKGLDLGGANLTGANLSHANLSGANLAAAVLTGSTSSAPLLSHVNFGGGTNLAGATFAGAYTLYANFSGAYLTNVDFTGANLDHAVLAGARMDGAVLSGISSQSVSISKGGNNLPPGYILRKGVILYCSSKYVCGAP